MLLVAGVLTIGAALAEAKDPYPWPHNGCTNAPDHVGSADFTYACNHHDGCYAEHWANRATCDGWFWNDMIAECRKQPFEVVTSCAGTAAMYYGAVRLFGDYYYNSNGKYVRIDTPMKTKHIG
jgi:hypothetical protein